MLFPSLQFAIFFVAVLAVTRSAPPHVRRPFLLGSSLFFYVLWHPPHLLLLAAVLVASYGLLQAIVRWRPARWPLVLAVLVTLLPLGFFKYAAFAVEALAPVWGIVGASGPEAPNLFLPLGISFYSFQIVAFAVDTYRKPSNPLPTFGRYALFVCFFPQLIAGPILRRSQLLPQIDTAGEVGAERSRRGLWLLASGLLKKVVFADFLLAPFVDEVFGAPGVGSAAFHWVALYSFAFEIYFDFAGYTDIARGLGCLLGFELPANFHEPYLSRNPAEFWRRWHVTLSTWLRDYLYIPLGGNRRGSVRTGIHLMLTMVIGGLWHGAGWNFVLWGTAHGLLLGLHRAFGRRGDIAKSLVLRDAPRIALCFHAVLLPWVLFRATTFDSAIVFYRALLPASVESAVSFESEWPAVPALIALGCGLLHVAERVLRPRLRAVLESSRPRPIVEGLVLGALLAVVFAAAGAGGEFIYFQF